MEIMGHMKCRGFLITTAVYEAREVHGIASSGNRSLTVAAQNEAAY